MQIATNNFANKQEPKTKIFIVVLVLSVLLAFYINYIGGMHTCTSYDMQIVHMAVNLYFIN